MPNCAINPGARLKISYAPKPGSRLPWLIVLPVSITGTGKRQWKRFSTRAAADEFRRDISARLAAAAAPLLTPEQSADATRALAILAGSDLSLTAAAALAIHARAALASVLTPPAPVADPPPPIPQTPPPPTKKGQGGRTFSSAIACRENALAHQSPLTIRKRRDYAAALAARAPWLSDRLLPAITSADIEKALRPFRDTPHYYNSVRSMLHALFAYWIRKGELSANPVTAVDPLHAEHAEIRPLSPRELAALFAACRPPTAADLAAARGAGAYQMRIARADASDCLFYVAIQAFCGIRPTECARLLWQDLDLEDGVVSVRRSSSKTRTARHVPLPPLLLDALRKAAPGHAPTDPITPPEGLKYRLAAVHIRAGFSGDNPWPDDCLRHSFAAYWLKAGRSLDDLQLAMGHRDKQLIYNNYANMAGLTKDMAAAWWNTPVKP